MYRILAIILLVITAVTAPLAATMTLAIVALFLFSTFWEAIAIGFFLDALYSVSEPRWFGFQFVYTSILLVSWVIIEQLKKSLRWYSNGQRK